MSHFYASINGSAKSYATRSGTPSSGITGHIRGWTAGVDVHGRTSQDELADIFYVYATSGSNGAGHSRLIATVTSTPTGPTVAQYDSDGEKIGPYGQDA